MTLTRTFIYAKSPRPKICRRCYAKVTYLTEESKKGKNSKLITYRITRHKKGCPMTKRKGMGGRKAKTIEYRAFKESQIPVNALALSKYSGDKLQKKINQYLKENY